ncbi:uncharacterized protein LOC126455993 isoform X2 [Schistocerca serialis cubense]|uniref:uncharacterized protein LOC126455993 isoform X2 n=1 Tax=Schistocerca serialis cubense TaxID=2023355 RepID=UPI00214F1223|nr:uncharacterized protein LOC126455993 isoform X2 [Schistocerca serialis cubense]
MLSAAVTSAEAGRRAGPAQKRTVSRHGSLAGPGGGGDWRQRGHRRRRCARPAAARRYRRGSRPQARQGAGTRQRPRWWSAARAQGRCEQRGRRGGRLPVGAPTPRRRPHPRQQRRYLQRGLPHRALAQRLPETSEGALSVATKHGVRCLAEGLRKDLAGRGARTRVTVISPGLVLTDVFQDFKVLTREAVLSRPHLRPEDVADALLYALSTPSHVQVNELVVEAVAQGSQPQTQL